MRKFVILLWATICLHGCSINTGNDEPDYTESGLLPENFYRIIDGDTTRLFVLNNNNGMEVCITNYGAHIVSIMVPGRDDVLRDVVMGMDSVGAYLSSANGELGALMGRYGGLLTHRRSAKSNEWMHRVFRVEKSSKNSLTLSLFADSVSDGMSGNVALQVDYALTDDNSLEVVITAISDALTPIDPAQRLFFNLNGVTADSLTSISGHYIQSKADQYLVRDSLQDYPGDMLMTIWTPFGFAKERKLSRTLNADFHQVNRMDGIDGYFVMPGYGEEMAEALKMYAPESGIEMTVSTSFPGFDLYTTNRFNGSIKGKADVSYTRRSAIAVMPHYYPDAPNMPGWGMNATLRPGEVIREKNIYHFDVRR